MAGGYLNKPVVNSTGLDGSWDFDIKWSGRGDLEKAGPTASPSSMPSTNSSA